MPVAPDLDAVKAYLGAASSWSDDEVTEALASERAAQVAVVRLPTDPEPPADPLPYPEDLAEALKRRVAHNLALRSLPLGLQASIAEAAVATTRVGGTDAEVKRLESPYRKRFVG